MRANILTKNVSVSLRLLQPQHPKKELKRTILDWASSKLKICAASDTMKKMKRQLVEWKKTFANYISDKIFVSRMYKELL